MSSPLEQAGAIKEPSQYAAISMDRFFTGLWTQRSPLRDADVAYSAAKFYGASRFDSLIDGINREVTAKLTQGRRPGSSVYNANSFPAINSFYPWKRIVNGTEVIRVIADGQDGKVYDATAGQKSTILVKAAGAGKARFQGVNTALYIADGVENVKYLQPGTWIAQPTLATTQYQVGTLIYLPSLGYLKYLTSVQVGTITSVQVLANTLILTFPGTNFAVTPGMRIKPTVATATFLNGKGYIVSSVRPSGSNFIVTCAGYAGANYGPTADSGTAISYDSGTPATTGNTQPAWSNAVNPTVDGLSKWYSVFEGGASPLAFPWQLSAPAVAPSIAPLAGFSTGIWQALNLSSLKIKDAAGFIWTPLGPGPTGPTLPAFATTSRPSGASNATLNDGGYNWIRSEWLGSTLSNSLTGPQSWLAITTPINRGPNGDVCVDSNGNLQLVTGGSGTTGSGNPTWNASTGGTTTDNGVVWTNLGLYIALAFQGWRYAYASHCIDGSLTTLSPLSPSTNGVISGITVSGQTNGDPEEDSIWIFRTADGESTPLLLAIISIVELGGGGTWTFNDLYTDQLLAAEVPGPQAEANHPPPVGMTAPYYHLGRMWGIFENTVVYSGGPDTLAGNGNTAFPPLNSFAIPEQPIRLTATITSAGPGLLVWGRANIYIILGQGTPSRPFQQAALYMAGCGILSYDALAQIGSTFYAFGNTALVGAQLVGKAFSLDPAAGYVEYGFPIGDQFANVTTGAGGRAPNSGVARGHLYDPAKTFVTWAELGSGDTALYVADGSVGWFRYSPVASPESGFLWSPRAVIAGGTSAVHGIETQPGVTQLLIGPAAAGGPILFRDSATHRDNGAAYPSYDVKGCIQLCVSGEVGEIAHVHLVSAAVGARPSVGLLFGEVQASPGAPFAWYDRTSSEPPTLAASESVYSDRYTMLSKGVTPKCLFFQLAMDYGTQDAPDETLLFSVYGAKYAERRQQ